MIKTAPIAAVVLVVLGNAQGLSAATYDDPDWPCVQRRVDDLALAQMWSGPLPPAEAAPAPEIRRLAAAIAPRRTALDAAGAQVRAELGHLAPGARAAALASLAAAVVDQIADERREVVAGIARYARGQAERAARVEAQQTELVALQAAEAPDLDRIEALEDRLRWDVRIFRERAQALSYVCETPVLLEQRAFAIARLLAGMI